MVKRWFARWTEVEEQHAKVVVIRLAKRWKWNIVFCRAQSIGRERERKGAETWQNLKETLPMANTWEWNEKQNDARLMASTRLQKWQNKSFLFLQQFGKYLNCLQNSNSWYDNDSSTTSCKILTLSLSRAHSYVVMSVRGGCVKKKICKKWKWWWSLFIVVTNLILLFLLFLFCTFMILQVQWQGMCRFSFLSLISFEDEHPKTLCSFFLIVVDK